MDLKVIDCGSFHKPQVDCLQLSNQVANCPSTGAALPEDLVHDLFSQGLTLGEKIAKTRSHLVVAECVPGGTTTALALLTALGYQVQGLLSSSLPSCNHAQRHALVESGLASTKHSSSELQKDGLLAVSALGDPMQAVAAGMAISASARIPVYLAGGSQMLAVWALIRALAGEDQLKSVKRNILVMSTKWVAHDPTAGVYRLAQMLDAPFAVASPDFHESSKAGLRAYEEGNVKEGVGAGASMCLARAAGFGDRAILSAIDNCYDELLYLSTP
jgi:uncharacterized protein (TIGR00303 family)